MLKIVDSHVHFWEPRRLRYLWLDDYPTLNQTYLPDHIPTDGIDWTTAALVFVQADCLAEQGLLEVDWVTALAVHDQRLQGIVAFAPLEDGEKVRPILEELNKRSLVKGIRRLIQSEPLGFSRQPNFVAGVRLLAHFDLTCDLAIRHIQLPDVIHLVHACPHVNFVLDHIGGPDIKSRSLDPWRKNLAELAALPNVVCKVSGLVTQADWQLWQAADLQPYLEHVFNVFGPERVMFGSDSPVALLAATYPQWVATLMAATQSWTNADREKLFFHNANKVYRLATECA